MAERSLVRRILAVFDRPSAQKAEKDLEQSMAKGGAAAGKAFIRELRAAFDKRMADLKVALAKGLIDEKQFKKQAALAAKEFNAGVIKGMEDARKAGTLTDKEYLKLTRTLKRVGEEGATVGNKLSGAFVKASAALATFFTIDKVVRFLRESVTEAINAEQSASRLDSVLQPLGLTYAQVGREVEEFTSRIQETTRFSDDDARDALTNLIAATGDYRKSLELLDVTAAIAEKRQITMKEAAQTAADASKGLTRGMKDLGISTGETGDIVDKIRRNLGNLATDALQTTSGQLASINNLWSDFKEQIGLAIIGSNDLKDAVGGPKGLRQALIDLNTWAKDHSKDITNFVDKLVEGGKALAAISRFILKFQPALALLRLATKEQAEAVAGALAPVVKPADAPPRDKPLTPEEIAARKRRAEELGRELAKVEEDIAIARLQFEKGLTEEQAREQARREQVLSGHVGRTTATLKQLEDAYLELAQARSLAGLGPPTTARTGQAPAQTEVSTAGQLGIPAPGDAPFAKVPDQKPVAKQFFDPWFEAMHLLREEVEGQGTLFAELGQAWAEGGLAGLARLAAGKVKENIARAIEEAAKAFGSLALGNPGSAALHAKAAAGHTAGAAAWKVLGGAIGGGSSGAGTAGGAAAGAGPLSDRPSRIEAQKPEVHIHLDGPGFDALNPRVQRIVFGALQNAREIYGQDAAVTIHRGNN